MTDPRSLSHHLSQPLSFLIYIFWGTFINTEVVKLYRSLATHAHVKRSKCSHLDWLCAGCATSNCPLSLNYFKAWSLCTVCLRLTTDLIKTHHGKIDGIILPSLILPKQQVKSKKRLVCRRSALLLAFEGFIRRLNHVCVSAPGDRLASQE